MHILRIYPTSINAKFVEEAADALKEGLTVCYPTDTFYALGCDATDNQAIERLCRVKGIDPKKHTLSIVCADLSQASEYAHIDNAAYRTLKRCLPGAFTFVLPASARLPKVFKGRRTVGIRVPADAVAVALARELGHPVLSTTAGEGTGEPEEIALWAEQVGAAVMLDGGSIDDAGPSTVVDLTDSSSPEVIREGKAAFE